MEEQSQKTGDFWSGLALSALGVYIVIEARQWEYLTPDGPGAGFFPLWYGIAMIVLSAVLVVSSIRRMRSAADSAIDWGRGALARAPSLVGLDRLLELEAGVSEAGARREELTLTRGLLRHQVQRQSRYVCAHCGFRARQYYWQCPGCNRWESCAPQRAEELKQA